MKTNILLATAISALALGASGVQAAPVLASNDAASPSNGVAVEQATYGYYYRPYYYPYYYKPYYYYRPYYKHFYYY
jgi:hypothetical protein